MVCGPLPSTKDCKKSMQKPQSIPNGSQIIKIRGLGGPAGSGGQSWGHLGRQGRPGQPEGRKTWFVDRPLGSPNGQILFFVDVFVLCCDVFPKEFLSLGKASGRNS